MTARRGTHAAFGMMDEVRAAIGMAVDAAPVPRTPEIERLAKLYDRLGEWCWCELPHNGPCPDDDKVLELADAAAASEAANG